METICISCGEQPAVYKTAQQCRRCYSRTWYQENAAHARVPAADRRNPVTYANAHWRVQKVRGKASDYACARCGAEAEEWSYTDGDPWEQTGTVTERRYVRGEVVERSCFMKWSPNPHAYEALCTPCHYRKDGRVS